MEAGVNGTQGHRSDVRTLSPEPPATVCVHSSTCAPYIFEFPPPPYQGSRCHASDVSWTKTANHLARDAPEESPPPVLDPKTRLPMQVHVGRDTG